MTGAYLTHWRYEGTPEPFSPLFVVLLEQQVLMLMDVQEESPCWLRDYSRLSDNFLGIAHVLVITRARSYNHMPRARCRVSGIEQ